MKKVKELYFEDNGRLNVDPIALFQTGRIK